MDERSFSIYPPKIGKIYEDIIFRQFISNADGVFSRDELVLP